MKHITLFLVITVVFSVLAAGQSPPPSAGELRYRLLSPFYLGGGAHITRTETQHGILLNPAVAAGFQRTVLDLNYINLQGLDTVKGMGHSANIGISIPVRRGVISTTMGFLDTKAYEETEMDLGTSAYLSAAFSKAIYSDLWFGIGLVGDLGQLDGTIQGGAALNVGFLHIPDDIWGLKNFSWGGSITGVGYRFGSSSRGYFNAIPGNITPAVGFALDLLNGEKTRLAVRTDLRLPSVTDLWLGVAGDLYLGQSARFSVSSSLTIRDAISGSLNTLIPSVTFGLNFALGKAGKERKIQTSELDIQAAASPLYAGIWGFGGGVMLPFGVKDTNPPVITMESDEIQYVSPNYDGVQDELILPYKVKDERFITTYKWQIVDSGGNPVRTFVNKEERPENESVQNLWTRLIAPRTGIPLPEVLRWDGITDAGTTAADGQYAVSLQFSDDNNNSALSESIPIVLDTAAPELKLQVVEGLDLIFSPDGDGLKDSFPVQQEGSQEYRWEAEFQDAAGNSVRTWTWSGSSPEVLDWDGRSDEGSAILDGVYRYIVQSTDEAGNATMGSIEGIIIDTKRPEIGLSIDRAVFSPGTASRFSTLTLTPEVSLISGIVDWSVDIVGVNGESDRSWTRTGSSPIPEELRLDGMNNARQPLEEGEYFGRLRLEYDNGYISETSSPGFVIDRTPPQASVRANWNVFSPQEGSHRDRVTFKQDSSPEKTWKGTIRNSQGDIVNEWSWIEVADTSLVWDGRSSTGRLVADGEYTYVLFSTDEAGNTGQSSPVSVKVDTRSVKASLTASLDVFGPTGNGQKDEVSFFLSAQDDSPVAGWNLSIVDSRGNTVMNWTGEGALPDQQIWNGRSRSGTRVDDGDYTGNLTVNYVKGTSASASTGSLTVDTESPFIEVSVRDPLFSPDGDGEKDVLEILQQSSEEERFEAYLRDEKGETVRSWLWSDSLKSIDWDGTDVSGNSLPDGVYSYVITGTDRAGNETTRRIENLQIDTKPTPVYLTAKEGYVKAGETDEEKFQSFVSVVPNTAGIDSWVFSIEDAEEQTIVSQSGEDAVPGRFEWDGTDARGKPVEGVFKGVLTVHYAKGTKPRAESRAFVSDGSPPHLEVTINPQPFSPDDDNVDDEVVIGFLVEDSSRISEWSFNILDPRKRNYISFSGRGRPSERIIWDGRSGKGELVESAEDYPYTFEVTDILGHTASSEGFIPVDVLVVREGNRLKIRINNMTFQPSSPRLTITGDEGRKNIKVLDRLAEIMKKYGRYRIIVEGHAVSLKWDNPAAAKREQDSILVPLSKNRAETVVRELSNRGIISNRLTAIGIGGSKPIVPHGDVEERWRNRRVEFYLEK